MYKFWMYYFGSPNNVGQDPPLKKSKYLFMISNFKLKNKINLNI